MEGVEEVRQVTPTGRNGSPKWVAYSESSTPRSPSRSRIIGSPARALMGQKHAGVVTFHRLADGRTRHGRAVLARPARVAEVGPWKCG